MSKRLSACSCGSRSAGSVVYAIRSVRGCRTPSRRVDAQILNVGGPTKDGLFFASNGFQRTPAVTISHLSPRNTWSHGLESKASLVGALHADTLLSRAASGETRSFRMVAAWLSIWGLCFRCWRASN